MKLLRSTATLFAIGWSVSCEADQRPCNTFVQQDESFEVTVVGPSDPKIVPPPWFVKDAPPCGFDDVHTGDVFNVELSKHVPYANDCYLFACPKDFPTPGLSLTESTGVRDLGYVCIGNRTKVKLAENCELGRFVALHSRQAQDLYAEPDPSNPFTLLRMLTLTGGNVECPDALERYPTAKTAHLCVDQWEVRLTERKPSADK